jgi:hypothetical protein
MKTQLKFIIKILFTTLVLTSIFGCSSKELYESIQPKYDENECRNLPPHQYDKCIKTEEKSYKEYQKEREDIIDN